MTGKAFGKLTVVDKVFVKNETAYWSCKCSCGNVVNVCGSNLRRKNRPTLSCGCNQKIAASKMHLSVNNVKFTIEKLWFVIIKNQIVRSARSRNIAFDLSDETIKKFCSSNCYYCGSTPFNKLKVKRREMPFVIYQGLDRIDSSIGYFEDNVRPCCKNCNKAKSSLSHKNFIDLIKRIYIHMSEKHNAF